jgi:hypothetical protein
MFLPAVGLKAEEGSILARDPERFTGVNYCVYISIMIYLQRGESPA